MAERLTEEKALEISKYIEAAQDTDSCLGDEDDLGYLNTVSTLNRYAKVLAENRKSATGRADIERSMKIEAGLYHRENPTKPIIVNDPDWS
jgi:hypothetical protein